MSMADKGLEIEYPCIWSYKVIGTDREMVQAAARDILAGYQFNMEFSNASSSGKYYSYNIELTVESELHRVGLFNALKGHDDIKMVL